MQWSPFQTAIFEALKNTGSSLVIQAVAGSGKTTTLVGAANQLSQTLRCLFLAFNRDIAETLGKKLPRHFEAKTFHSLGMGILMRALEPRNRKAWVDANKSYKLIDRYVANLERQVGPGMARAMSTVLRGPVKALVSFAKQVGIGVEGLASDNEAAWLGIWTHHGMDFDYRAVQSAGGVYQPSLSDAVAMARWVLAESVKNAADVIDYDDMIYLVLRLNLNTPRYDIVFIDEAQDTNPVRRELALRCRVKGGRIVAVGDSRQAIYGFTGADHNAMDLIREATDAVELPLSVTYRCPKAVVALAREVVSHIEAAPEAPEGHVEYANLDEMDIKICFKPGDAILCRNTKPLVQLAYRLIKNMVGCRIAGRDIGQGLVSLVEKMNRRDLPALRDRLEEWCGAETARLIAKDQEAQAEAVSDKVESLLVLIEMMPEGSTIDELKATIDRLFSDEKGAGQVVLSTIHKAKGLEWSKVYLLKPDLLPSKWARQAWQLLQEDNLLYVAYTRAMDTLVLLEWADKKEKA